MPAALQTIGWTLRPLPFLQRCREAHGDTFTLRIRHGGTWVMLSDPADVKRVFTAQASSLGVGEANSLLGPVLGSRSVMLLEEPEHMRHRKHMLPPFHGERMMRYGDLVTEVTRNEVARWPVGEPFALWPRMQAITLEVIMRAVFGELESPGMRLLRSRMEQLTSWMNNPVRLGLLAAIGPRWLAGSAGFRTMMGSVEEAVLDEVRRRRASVADRADGTSAFAGAGGLSGTNGASPTGILDELERAHHEDGSPLSEREMRDELMTLILDGPTSSSLAWSFERLLRHPDKLARLREETLAGEEDRYLDAVVKETLRLRPAVPIVVRRLLEPMQLGKHLIPAGATVAPCIYLVHRREDVYEQPLAFMPERFLERPPGTYTWIPFGGGVRRCLAASFAVLEMKRVMRTILEAVELRAPDATAERIARSAIAFAPERHGLVMVTRRL